MEFLDVSGSSWILWCCFSFEEDRVFETSPASVIRYADKLGVQLRESRIWKAHPVIWVSYLRLSKLLALLLRSFSVLPVLERTYLGSPLHAASIGGNIRVVQLLWSVDADVNERGGYWEYPLVAAILCRSVEVVQLLLKSGVNVNPLVKRHDGTTLIAACREGSAEIVRLLLDSGANVNFVVEKSE
jgi:hypothetical protein